MTEHPFDIDVGAMRRERRHRPFERTADGMSADEVEERLGIVELFRCTGDAGRCRAIRTIGWS
jgi:hypothetical protein